MKELSEFLKETEFCDYKNLEIKKIADYYKYEFTDKRELAVKLFEFVRDEIKYKVGPWNKKASTTLRDKAGMCTNSTNLLVALCRAVGIPAGYFIYRVKGGESFGHIIPELIKSPLKKHSVHIICGVYLNHWIKCDPSTDKDLSSKTKHISKITNLVEWNGENDSVHDINPEHIIEIIGPLANIDYQMKKKPRYIVRKYIFRIGNYYIDFLRSEGIKINSHKDIELQFSEWIKDRKKLLFYKYKIMYKFFVIKHNLSYNFKKTWKHVKRKTF